MKIILSILIGTALGIASNVVSNLIAPKTKRGQRIAWSTLVGLVVLSISVALLPDLHTSTEQPPNNMSPTPVKTTTTTITPFPPIAQLTADKWNNFIPSFSPDGKRIVFISDRDGNHEIYMMNIDGTQPQRLTNTPNISEDVPFYSPDGKKIIFSGNDGHDEEIYIMNADGSHRMNITNKPDSNEGRPRISPSGLLVTFDSDRGGNWEIYLARLQNNGLSDIKQVTNRPDFTDRLPSFSPLGDMILFRAEIIGGGPESSRIYRVNLDGTNLSRVLDLPNAFYPAISPDGRWVAFTSAQEGDSEIYVTALNGSGLRRLTDHPADDNYPAFSYDGKWIVFASKREGISFNIFRMRFDPTTY